MRTWLLFAFASALTATACDPKPGTRTSPHVQAPPGSPWTSAWIQTTLVKLPPIDHTKVNLLAGSGPTHQWELTMSLESDGPKGHTSWKLLSPTDESGRLDYLKEIYDKKPVLRASPDGRAFAYSLDGKNWRAVRYELGEPFSCAHGVFQGDFPPIRAVVLDVLSPTHETDRPSKPPPLTVDNHDDEIEEALSLASIRERDVVMHWVCDGKGADDEGVVTAYTKLFVSERGTGDPKCMTALARRYPAAKALVMQAPFGTVDAYQQKTRINEVRGAL